jgi:GNAT superfamily N-acetyltransferase
MSQPSESFDIQPARLADAEILARFNCQLADETEGKVLNPETVLRGVCGLFDDRSRGRYLVAREKDSVIGQLLITIEWSDWRNGEIWWIQSVYVAPEQRNRGVFKALYQAVFEEAKTRDDVVGIRLYVEDHNLNAQKVYQNLGMSHAGYQVMEFMKT